MRDSIRELKIKPEPPYEAKGETMTSGELKSFLKAQPGWESLDLSIYGRGGFDTCISARALFSVSENGVNTLYITGNSSWTHFGLGVANEITFRKNVFKRFGMSKCLKKSSLEEALKEAKESDKIFLAFKRDGVISDTGRHFIVPLLTSGPQVFENLCEEGDPEKTYFIDDSILSISGGI